MTKTFTFVILALLYVPTAVQAAAGVMEGGPGCGLGALLWADSISKKHIMQQSFIVTTNLTGLQTFGISSGTSGCTNDGVIVWNERAHVFVATHIDDLLQEMAQGSGEHVSALASLLGVPASDHAALFVLLQQDSPELLSSPETLPQSILLRFHAAHNHMAVSLIKS